MAKVKTQVGQRVKVTKGTDESLKPNVVGLCTHKTWIAGRIPVGAVGTVYEVPQAPHEKFFGHPPRFAIDFGQEFPAKPGYYYGILDQIDEATGLQVVSGGD